ncbi:MAG TPA: OmpA family protein [Candidatus Paceibacterota bacterium]|nr:OmpA family protein [Verrucomicrobiota bacterium]HSA12918.1 OmpA family protein [Candidatus Paceibacterota bacterium]
MKLNKFANLMVIGLVLTIAASGCRKKPVNTTVLPGSRAGRVAEAPPGGLLTPGTGVSTGEGVGSTPSGFPMNPAGSHQGWPEDAQALKAETVYFDFDSSAIKASEQSKITAVADYLKSNSAKAVRVEGNCDERGTEEYNRALGERRAQAVRAELINLGIDPTRVDTKTWGKDNPANDPGHDETAWRKNRRDDFIVLSPPGS